MGNTERSIKIRLTAEAKSLKDELKESTVALKALREAGNSTDRELAELQARSDKAGIALLKLAADGKISGEALRSADRDVNGLNRDLAALGAHRGSSGLDALANLSAQTAGVKDRMVELSAEFRRTGSAESLAGFKAAEAELRKLEALGKDVESVMWHGFPLNAEKAGEQAGRQMAQGMERGMSGMLSPQMLALGAAVAVVATPVIETGIATAVGTGMVAGAAVLQKDDPAITAGFTKLKQDAAGVFKGATAPLVPEFEAALSDLDKFVLREKPLLSKAFAELGPAIQPLEKTIESVADPILRALPSVAHGFNEIFSDPRTISAANRLGNSIGDVFKTVADNHTVIESTFTALSDGVQAVTKVFDFTVRTVDAVEAARQKLGVSALLGPIYMLKDALTGSGEQGEFLSLAAGDAGSALHGAVGPAEDLRQALDDLNQSISETFNETMNLDQANLAMKADMAGLKGQLDEHSRSLNTNTAAGRQNADALLNLVQDAEAVREAQIASGKPIEEANRQYQAQINKIETLARQLGLSKNAVQALIDKYKDLAAAPDIHKTVRIGWSIGPGGKPIPDALGGIHIPAAANGLIAGVYPASNPPLIQFAEPQTGGETLIPNRGIPQSRGLALADYAARQHGGHVERNGAGGSGGTGAITLENKVYLDGQPFRAWTAEAQRQEAWRSRRR